MKPRGLSVNGRGSHPNWVHACTQPGCTSAVYDMGDIHPRFLTEDMPWWTWDGRHLWCADHGPNGQKH